MLLYVGRKPVNHSVNPIKSLNMLNAAPKNVLIYDMKPSAFKPTFYLYYDESIRAHILSIRGT